jgi:hypothetical protein
MGDLFYSPRLTLVRAQLHIRDFNTLIDEFVKSNPWAHIVERDPQSGHHVHKIKFTQQLPEMLPCILFDAANNLRAVLDQAGYASAIASGKSSPKRTNFPFGDDPAGLDSNIKGRKVCDDCPAEIITLFRGFNPYKGGSDPLWALNRLCNTKKHCALVPLQMNNATVAFTAAVIGHGVETYTVSPASTGLGWNPKENEFTLMTTHSGMQPNITANVAFDVAIDGIDTIGGQQARHVLAAMSRIVESILLATEAKCRCLGFQIK